jgi:hypothetical protein
MGRLEALKIPLCYWFPVDRLLSLKTGLELITLADVKDFMF